MGIGTGRGYDVHSGRIQSEKTDSYRDKSGKRKVRNHIAASSNGRLYTRFNGTGDSVKLWVYEWQTGFSLNGTMGQSMKKRSFFPRNRVQQSISVSCQFPDQKSYGDAIEWIRVQQVAQRSSMMLDIIGKRVPVKGSNSTLQVEGYVKSVQRQHQRFMYAPELRFDFLVERIWRPSNWADSGKPVVPNEQPDWNTVFIKGGTFKGNPDASATPTPPSSVGEAISQVEKDFTGF